MGSWRLLLERDPFFHSHRLCEAGDAGEPHDMYRLIDYFQLWELITRDSTYHSVGRLHRKVSFEGF